MNFTNLFLETTTIQFQNYSHSSKQLELSLKKNTHGVIYFATIENKFDIRSSNSRIVK